MNSFGRMKRMDIVPLEVASDITHYIFRWARFIDKISFLRSNSSNWAYSSSSDGCALTGTDTIEGNSESLLESLLSGSDSEISFSSFYPPSDSCQLSTAFTAVSTPSCCCNSCIALKASASICSCASRFSLSSSESILLSNCEILLYPECKSIHHPPIRRCFLFIVYVRAYSPARKQEFFQRFIAIHLLLCIICLSDSLQQSAGSPELASDLVHTTTCTCTSDVIGNLE